MILVLNNKRFGNNVRHLRTKQGHTQARLAELAGMPEWALRDLESGAAMEVEGRSFQALCRILGRDMQKMLDEDMTEE